MLIIITSISLLSCSKEEGKNKTREIKESLKDFIETGDSTGILKYLPDNLNEFRIYIRSTKSSYWLQTFDDVETIFDEITDRISGESISIVQVHENEMQDSLNFVFTIKVIDGAFERAIPLKASFSRERFSGRWVITAIDLYD